jgi:hypothetical protein
MIAHFPVASFHTSPHTPTTHENRRNEHHHSDQMAPQPGLEGCVCVWTMQVQRSSTHLHAADGTHSTKVALVSG